MAKAKTIFVCQECGARYPKWSGRCDNCGNWNTLIEEIQVASAKNALSKSTETGSVLKPTQMKDIALTKATSRLTTGFPDIDAVLGGGILSGGVTLLAGQPGIGKSTILLQMSANISKTRSVLYVSGEESEEQVKLRAKRLGADTDNNLSFISSTNANDIATTIQKADYDLVVVDSIQTLSLNEVASAPGSVSQITNSANAIIRAAKSTGTSVILVGHVTKEGSIAGPKVLEHLVDVVLNFEGDRYGGFKLIRAAKNRYGSTSEVAIMAMSEKGLEPVENPSAMLLKERQNSDGSIILVTLEGNRPLLVEIQALVNTSNFGYPKRTASGFDLNRLNLLVAVLEKRTKLKLADKDIYINVVGGIKLADPAADLAIVMAIASAATERKLSDDIVVFGEVGLGGEIRTASQVEKRIAEAKKLGFKHAIAPRYNQPNKDSFLYEMSNIRDTLIKFLQN